MTASDPSACALRSCALIATSLAVALATAAIAQTPRPGAKHGPASPAANPAKLDAVKQHDQELDALRNELRKSSETEQRLTTENDSIAEERRKLNQQLID